ncbi:MAG TPA: multicopper oxidase domain-containing protein [Nitrososphaeraceae archaeon]|nr:multicopper oxidase domain-containing protein [Nitrososphaeraceae archaeon]
MLRSPVIISIIVITTAFAVFITITFGAYKGLNSLVGGGQISGSDSRIVGGHVPGYPVATTSGSILDPAQMDVDANLSNYVDDPMKYLREFNYGRVSELSDGRILREFTLIASDSLVKEISPGVFYNVWTFNGTVPGPTIRATEGDLIRIKFMNNGSMAHSLHLHGVHPANMDGVFDMVSPGGTFTYEFTAEPFGVFPYHCHMTPLEEHIAHGLYGVFIVDPRTARPPADEMVMVMNGYDTDFDAENNFYTVNGIPYYYMHHPIKIEKDRLVRIYLVNMLEYDPLNNFHLHANMFNYYPSGTRLQPDVLTDIVTTNQGERGILEFTYKYPGKYMFHAHKTEFAEKGWMGTFLVTERGGIQNSNQTDTNPYYDVLNNSFVRSGIEGDQM